MGELVDAIIILSIVLVSVILDFTQEYRAERAAEALRRRVATTATTFRNSDSYALTVTANIHTVGETQFGRIDETFEPVLKGTLSGNILQWDKELTKTEAGIVKETRTIPNAIKHRGLLLSGALAGIFLLFFVLSVILYAKWKPAELSRMEEEALRTHKRYRERIAEATDQTPIPGEKMISLVSMEDLIKVADELGKPIIHQPPATAEEQHVYYVFDGATRYQYVLTSQSLP